MAADEATAPRTLSNGVAIPSVGFGCAFGDWVGRTRFQGFTPEASWQPLLEATRAGYRHFDGAHCYGTERHLGDTLGRFFAEGALDRDDVFLTTKLAHPAAQPHVAISPRLSWDWDQVPDIAQRVFDDFEASKEKVGVGYFDLALMHWPGPFGNEDGDFARRARATLWSVFETLLERAHVRAIGVSNFARRHLETLLEDCDTAPMVNQLELHPYCQDPDLVRFCEARGIVVEAYAPFASGAFGLLQDPALVAIAEQVDRSTGQVVLRWHLQHGRVVLPKSANPGRIAQNLDVADFALDDDAMRAIDGLAPAEAKRTTLPPENIV